MRPLIYTDAGARIAFYVVFGTFVLLELAIRLRSSRNHQGSSADRGSIVVVWATVAGGLAAAFALAASAGAGAIHSGRWSLFVAGIVLMILGVVLRQWAVALLGRYFTTDVRVHAGQTVVDTGPYRWVRHPSYTGLLITVIGIGLALGNWVSIAVLAIVPTAGVISRIRVEERALTEGLGEPYRRFAATRAHLIPGVW
jgi:protein-S-isoprenylcysteine O-methyltransferase Ste14